MDDDNRCPWCDASNPPGAEWCGQCHSRFAEPLDPEEKARAADDDPDDGQSYLAATVGAAVGCAGGTGLALLVASQMEGDPNAGLANVAWIGAAILLTALCYVLGTVGGSFALLHLLHHRGASITSLILLMLLAPSVVALLMVGVPQGLFVAPVALAPLARYLALNLKGFEADL